MMTHDDLEIDREAIEDLLAEQVLANAIDAARKADVPQRLAERAAREFTASDGFRKMVDAEIRKLREHFAGMPLDPEMLH